jgi:hypothetical protein
VADCQYVIGRAVARVKVHSDLNEPVGYRSSTIIVRQRLNENGEGWGGRWWKESGLKTTSLSGDVGLSTVFLCSAVGSYQLRCEWGGGEEGREVVVRGKWCVDEQ